MENGKKHSDINKTEIKKNRREELTTQGGKPKSIFKNEIEVINVFDEDRGDSVRKAVEEKFYPKRNRSLTLNRHFEKLNNDIVAAKTHSVSKNDVATTRDTISKNDEVGVKRDCVSKNDVVAARRDSVSKNYVVAAKRGSMSKNDVVGARRDSVSKTLKVGLVTKNITNNEPTSKGPAKLAPKAQAAYTGDTVLRRIKNKLVLKNTDENKEIRNKNVKNPAPWNIECSKNINHNELIPKDDTIVNLMTERGDFVCKTIKNQIVHNNTKRNKAVKGNEGNAAIKYDFKTIKQNEESTNSTAIGFMTDKVRRSIKNEIVPGNIKRDKTIKTKTVAQMEFILKNYGITTRFDKTKLASMDNRKDYASKSKYSFKTDGRQEGKMDRVDTHIPVKTVVVGYDRITNSHNRLLEIDKKKQIRDKYTFKPKLKIMNNITDGPLDSQVEDKKDIWKKASNENKKNTREYAKSETIKTADIFESTEKSRKRPIVKTIVAKNEVNKIYKAITFIKEKNKPNTSLHIKLPVVKTGLNVATKLNAKTPNTSQNTDVNLRKYNYEYITNAKISVDNVDELMKYSKDSFNANNFKSNTNTSTDDAMINTKTSTDVMRNTKIPTLFMRNNAKPPTSVMIMENTTAPKGTIMQYTKTPYNINMNNTKIQTEMTKHKTIPMDALRNTKIQKLQYNDTKWKSNKKMLKKPRKIKNCESKISAKTKIIKKDKRQLKRQRSSVLLVKGSKSPQTEVAHSALTIDQHTKPYYEAWLEATLAVIARKNNRKHNIMQNFNKSVKKLIEQRDKSPELVHEKHLDERYIGKIKINHRQ